MSHLNLHVAFHVIFKLDFNIHRIEYIDFNRHRSRMMEILALEFLQLSVASIIIIITTFGTSSNATSEAVSKTSKVV